MKFPEGQLKETLKILVIEFVNGVEKVCNLHHEFLAQSKHEIYPQVLNVFSIQRKEFLLDECVKLLESNYEEKIKHQCFQKSFSVDSSGKSYFSSSKMDVSFQESDAFGSRKQHSEHSSESLHTKKLHHLRSSQVTKYNVSKQDVFDITQHLLGPSESEKCQVKKQKIDSSASMQEQSSLQSVSNDEQDEDYSVDEQSGNDSQKQDSLSKDNLTNTLTSSKFTRFNFRKKYRSYTQQQRIRAVLQARQMGLQFSSKNLNIPRKNIARWMKIKDRMQKVRGRRPGDPQMEGALTKWILNNLENNNYLTQTEIRNQARKLSVDPKFKASKGWLQKFFRRNKPISDELAQLLNQKRILNSKKQLKASQLMS